MAKRTIRSDETDFAGVRLSSPDKVLYPEQGVTKADLARYYLGVEKWMLPHVVDRPLALVRCPAGRGTKCFFQRNWTDTLPDAIGKIDVIEGAEDRFHVTIGDIAGIISLVQVGVLEMHTWNCTNKDITRPDQLIFDLDPGPEVAWKQVLEGARLLRKHLEKLGLLTFLKTSGGKGLHICVPIKPNTPWPAAKDFARRIATEMSEAGDLFVANMRKDLRVGKIYLDYQRNDEYATAVAPYSTRAREGAPVSMPIRWDELGKLKSANQYNVQNAANYLSKRKADPWKDWNNSRADISKLL